MDDVKTLLGTEIRKEILNLPNLEAGSDKKSKAIDDVAKLYRLRIEEIKAETECKEKQNQYALALRTRSEEMVYKEAQRKDQIVDRWINVALQGCLAIGGWLAYDIWHRRGLKFEETGTITSPLTRNLLSRMLPKK